MSGSKQILCHGVRLLSATFNTEDGALTIFQAYAYDSQYPDEEYSNFLDMLQDEINMLPRKNSYIIIGDFNAKVGSNEYQNWPNEVGRYGLGVGNERGFILLQFCAIDALCIMNTCFKHKQIRRETWISPDGHTKNQIDYIIVPRQLKHRVKNGRTYHSADIGSDHSLVMANIEAKIKKTTETCNQG